MKGLRTLLNEEIERKGYITINEVHDFAKSFNYKESNAERRLRPSESPNIETVRDRKGNNIGYKYISLEVPRQEEFNKPAKTLFKIENNGSAVSDQDLLKYR